MISKRLTSFGLMALCVVLSVLTANAQTFNGSIINQVGNTVIPSVGSGGCTVAPQTTGGDTYTVAVAGLTNQVVASVQMNLTHTWDADLQIYLESPTGQRIELTTGNGGSGDNYTNTQFSDAAATNITAGAAPFTGTFRPEGSLTAINCGTIITPTITTLGAFTAGQNGNWVLRTKDNAAGDVGNLISWSITFAPPCDFVLATLPPQAVVGTNPAICGFSGNITSPAVTTTCPPGTLLTVTIDGVAAGTIAPNTAFPVALSPGIHTIRFTLPNGNFRDQTFTVTDGVAPVITCPSNMLINLDPGACSAIVNYSVTATDNCPFFVQQTALVFPPVLLPHGAGALTVAGNNLPGGNFFNLTNTSANPVQITGYRVRFGTFTFGVVPSPRQVNTYISNGNTFVGQTANAASWTSTGVASVTVAGPNSELSQVNITPYVLAPGQTKGVYLMGTQSSLVYNNGANFNANIAQGPFNLMSGASSVGLFGGSINNRTPNVEIQFAIQGPIIPVQTAGLPSASEFPIGTTTNCFKATDAAGLTATCCFTITVIEFPNPITSLVCNDLVYVSLDQSCSYCLGADGVLEGGPYHCYDDYIVEVDRTLPFGNGPWAPACFTSADIGKTYQVRVTDPSTGNKCWGNVKIEDKLPPVLTCCDYNLPCNADPSPIFGNTNLTANASGNVPVPIPDLGTASSFAAVSTCTGATVLDVNVALSVTHTFVGDLRITLISPAGTTVVLWPRQCGGNDNLNFGADDEAPTCTNLCADYNSGGVFRPIACLGPQFGSSDFLSKFDGENPVGAWELRVQDQAGLDVGTITGFTLSILYNAPSGTVPIVDENCCFDDLVYIDTEVLQDCASGLTRIISRKWTASDCSGNTSTCIQLISFDRPSLNDVVTPPDYDGIDAPFFTCEANLPIINGYPNPTPDYIESLGLQGFPYIFGLSAGCNINYEYHDYVIPVCDGTVKYRREWTIIDWCTGTGFIFNQIIKVVDDEGPSIICPANLTVSTDPFTCCATINLPDVIVEDNCSRINNISGMIVTRDPFTGVVTNMVPIGGQLQNFPGNNFWDLDTLANFGFAPCLPIGTHTVTYVAADDCGNTSSCTFSLTVRDFVPPVAACDETTTIAIGVDDPFDCYGPAGPNDLPTALDACEFAGVTWVKATTFDDGSYDNCGGVKFTIRRMAPPRPSKVRTTCPRSPSRAACSTSPKACG